MNSINLFLDFMRTHAAITGVASYLPEYIMKNEELEEMVDTTSDWIMERSGIRERRILKDKDKATAFMAAEAAKKLLKKKNINPLEVELVIVCTATPEYQFPATANVVCHMIGATNAWSFDLLGACSGFVYALTVASKFIETGTHKKVLVIGSDKMSSIVDWTDRRTCILFGDGAGAVLLEPDSEGYGIVDSRMYSDGSGQPHLYQVAGGSLNPASEETVKNRQHHITMNGQAVFKLAVVKMADVAEEMMMRNGLTAENVAYLVPHQANKRIIEVTAERMHIGMDKVMLNIERYGNTTTGTIPICLDEWETKLKKGDNIIITTFGAGFTWGGIYAKWAYDTPEKNDPDSKNTVNEKVTVA
ncbi:MAG: 3-oxoacyl-acyl-carrier-protein synthase III [Bacteroidetes bacterium]|nr:MAG: 3-oxoacyl-acyl-carrier-protein synthase III [Bacteroidota bacterium]